ncbi:MAG: PilZ domain-containing protein [Angustibacter sp.]
MDITIAAGASLTLVAGPDRVTLKTLAETTVHAAGAVEDSAGARVPVIGSSEALVVGPGTVDVATPQGVVSLRARVVTDGSGMSLHLGSAAPVTQRRQEVRGDVELPMTVTIPASVDDATPRVVTGRTRNLSAGGLLATLDLNAAGSVRPGMVVPVVVEWPEGEPLQVPLQVIEVANFTLRGSFVGIEHRQTERIARLVFAKERERLAARRRQSEQRSVPVPGRTRSW